MAAAITPTVSLLFLDTDPQTFVASVIAAQPSATTYLVNCQAGTDSSDCGIYDETITAQAEGMASPTYDALMANPGAPSDTASALSFHCGLSSVSGSAVPTSCIGVVGGSSTAITGTDLGGLWDYYAVTITAGAEKLSDMTASASATPTAIATSSDSVFMLTGTVTPPTGATSVASSTTAAQSTGAAVAARELDAGAGSMALLGLILARVFA